MEVPKMGKISIKSSKITSRTNLISMKSSESNIERTLEPLTSESPTPFSDLKVFFRITNRESVLVTCTAKIRLNTVNNSTIYHTPLEFSIQAGGFIDIEVPAVTPKSTHYNTTYFITDVIATAIGKSSSYSANFTAITPEEFIGVTTSPSLISSFVSSDTLEFTVTNNDSETASISAVLTRTASGTIVQTYSASNVNPGENIIFQKSSLNSGVNHTLRVTAKVAQKKEVSLSLSKYTKRTVSITNNSLLPDTRAFRKTADSYVLEDNGAIKNDYIIENTNSFEVQVYADIYPNNNDGTNPSVFINTIKGTSESTSLRRLFVKDTSAISLMSTIEYSGPLYLRVRLRDSLTDSYSNTIFIAVQILRNTTSIPSAVLVSAGTTSNSLSFRVTNNDSSQANISYTIRRGSSTSTNFLSGTPSSNFQLGPNSNQTITLSNLDSGISYFLTDVVATVPWKNSSSSPAAVSGTTTSVATGNFSIVIASRYSNANNIFADNLSFAEADIGNNNTQISTGTSAHLEIDMNAGSSVISFRVNMKAYLQFKDQGLSPSSSDDILSSNARVYLFRASSSGPVLVRTHDVTLSSQPTSFNFLYSGDNPTQKYYIKLVYNNPNPNFQSVVLPRIYFLNIDSITTVNTGGDGGGGGGGLIFEV
jgi:hypothetical protein